MSRLPTPGSDSGTWGIVLNDFLSVAHNTDGTLAPNVIGSSNISDGSIVNADISSSAAIAESKISGLTTDLASKVTNATGQNLTLWKGTAAAYAAISAPDSNTVYMIVG